jgi:hypothetical protein
MNQRNTEQKDGTWTWAVGLGTWDTHDSLIHSYSHAHPRTYNWGRRAEQLRKRLGWRWYVCGAVGAVGGCVRRYEFVWCAMCELSADKWMGVGGRVEG